MPVYVDADACPGVIKQILFKAAERTGIAMTFIANQPIQVPRLANINALQVPPGFDVADNEIAKRVEKNDLVITSDIPLADEVITKGALAISFRGEAYTKETIKARLNIRDFMDTMRSSGVQSGGPAAYSSQDKQRFANALDKWLAKNKGI